MSHPQGKSEWWTVKTINWSILLLEILTILTLKLARCRVILKFFIIKFLTT